MSLVVILDGVCLRSKVSRSETLLMGLACRSVAVVVVPRGGMFLFVTKRSETLLTLVAGLVVPVLVVAVARRVDGFLFISPSETGWMEPLDRVATAGRSVCMVEPKSNR